MKTDSNKGLPTAKFAYLRKVREDLTGPIPEIDLELKLCLLEEIPTAIADPTLMKWLRPLGEQLRGALHHTPPEVSTAPIYAMVDRLGTVMPAEHCAS